MPLPLREVGLGVGGQLGEQPEREVAAVGEGSQSSSWTLAVQPSIDAIGSAAWACLISRMVRAT